MTLRVNLALLILVASIAPSSIVVAAQEKANSFAISISSPDTQPSSGSMIRLYIAVKSQTSKLLILDGLRNSPRQSGVVVRDSKGGVLQPKERWNERSDTRLGSKFSTDVPPEGSITEMVVLTNWFDLSAPGQYTIQVRKKDPISGGWVESNKLTITVASKQ